MNEIQFGLNVPTAAGPSDDPVGLAVRADAAGFDFVSSNDHPCGTSPNFETWSLLTWIAAKTTRVSVATRVLGVPYRPPAMVAKMAESLDRLSGGRFILGLGGGYSDDEFRAFGLRVPTPREKIEGLEEAIEIARGLWSQSSFTYEGKHYRTDNADIAPKPDRAIPIWVGTFGPRALDLTGRLADGWIPTLSEDATPERIPKMLGRIEKAAERSGRDPGSIRRVFNLDVDLRAASGKDPFLVSGTTEQIVDRLTEFAALGFDGFNFGLAADGRDEQLDQLAREVLPGVRDAL